MGVRTRIHYLQRATLHQDLFQTLVFAHTLVFWVYAVIVSDEICTGNAADRTVMGLC